MTSSFDALAALASTSVRFVPALALFWLAVFFGRTLRSGQVPLIERVARIEKPDLSPALCRYTRALTAAWSAYFVAAALFTLAASLGFAQASVGAASVSALLFVGEHWIRRWIFPGEWFPDLYQQIRDTVAVWRPRRRA